MKQYNLKYILLLGVGLLVVVSFGWGVRDIYNKDKIIIAQKLKNQDLDEKVFVLAQNMIEQMPSTGISVGMTSLLAEKNNKEKLSARLKLGSLLAVRVSPLSCSMCVDSTITSLNKFIKKDHFKNRVIILTSYNKERDLILFRRLQQINDIEIFNINEDEITLPIENEKKPYMFVIDSSLISKSVFIPEKNIPKLTDLYLKYVSKNYFEY